MLRKTNPKTTKKPPPTVPQNVAVRKATSRVENVGALTKDWIELTKQVMLCSGNYSQAHKRFRGHNQQSAAVCIVACALPTLRKMNTWTREVLDQILEIGTHLYLKSRQVNDNRCIEYLKPSDIYKYFFLGNLKISMKVGVDTYQERLPRDSYLIKKIEEFLKRFFRNYASGVFACQNTYFAIWRYDKYFCIFDPTEHGLDGGKWTGLPGLGYCYCIRSPNLKVLAEIIAKNCPLKQINKFLIHPCFLEKYIIVNTVPPETLEEVKPIPLEVQETFKEHKAHKHVKKIKKPPEPPAPDKAADAPKPGETPELAEGQQPASGEIKPQKSVSKSMIPPERPKLRSVTNFAEVFGKGGILRASTHQRDPRFTRYLGAQGFANALAALTMLRQHKARHWIKNILDDVLKLGEKIHHDSKKLPPGQIIKKITLNEIDYTPKVDKVAAVGRLESTEENILNLDETVKNYLLESDCCILKGPHIVAIWKEDDRYYMFDPEERNAAGRPAELGYPGVACVTWYTKPSDLVATYLSNVPKDRKKDRFILSKVAIKDYNPVSDDWYNFKALTVNKWILRGNFSQQDRRFPPESRNAQCTANATMALTYKELKQEHEWNTDTVDQVLMNGDEFYRNCVEYLQECGRFKDRYLMVDEIKRNFDVENKRVNLEIDDCLVNGIVNARSDTGIPNLRKGFEEFFVESDAGIVTANLQSMAVWKRDNTYFYYDSHSRNEKGVVSGFGTACVLRVVNIDDLTNALTINLGADPQNFYNISRVVVKLFDVTEDGMVKPPLNFYVALNDLIAILRSNTSEKDKKYNICAGKQTVPMLLAAIAYNDVTPSFEWTREDVDQVLDFGNKLYVESMEANYKEDTPEDQNVDEITTNNVKKDLKIGPNSIELELEEVSTGTIENIQEALEGLQERVAQEGNSAFQTILESEYQTVSMWRDDNLFYLFDSKERDESGNIYGRDEWSVKIVEVDEDEEEGEDEEIEGKKEEGDLNENKDEMGGGDNLGEPEETQQAELNYDEAQMVDDEEMEEEEEEEPLEKKGSEFWRNKADEEGKACVLRFSKLEDLINHIKENTPPNKREEIEYTLKAVKVKNTPVLHEVFDPEVEDKVDEFAGDWNEFKEMDYGKWILRAIRSFKDALFPECNRGKQAIPMCIVALAFSHMYALSKFKQDVVDNILIYGDRLHTVARKLRGKELKANKELGLTEDEIELILADTRFDVVDYPRKMCMGEKLASWEVTREAVKGDTTSKVPETVHNVLSALTAFFEEHSFGILECRDYPVAVWKRDDIFYMFDPHPCGPAGVQSPIGEACITRFKELEELSKVYLENLPKLFGKNMFEIHALTFAKDICKRPRHPEKKEEKAAKIGGFNDVTAGKSILRGDLKLDCTKFDRGVHIHSAPIAYVALALSLNKDPDTWTRIIVNEILKVGEELYNDTLDKLGETYNPWADRLDVCRVNPDFSIGSLRVNCAIRFTEQRGIVDIKNSKTLNLRQGIEKFFEENSHGILVADKFVLAIWEQAKGKDVSIYIFDPNSRGGTGLPSQGGVACVMKFCNAKVASDHIKASMMDIDKTKTRFSIIPIEIVIGTAKTKRKCPLLSDGTQMTASTKRALGASTKMSTMSKPKTCSNVPVTCPTKADIAEQKRTLRLIAEDQRARRDAKRCAHLGRDGMYEINNNQSVIRGLRSIIQDRELPVNLVAFVFMRLATDINKWTYKQIELILEAGYQLYVDSFNAYKPENKKLNLRNVLRRVLLKDFEVKIEIKKPILGGALTRDNLLIHLTNLFNVINFCILSYDEYLVSLYFKGGYYFLFDPYSRDLYGNKCDDGFAIMMRFGDLDDLVNKIVRNFVNPDDEMKKRYALILVGITSVEPLVM